MTVHYDARSLLQRFDEIGLPIFSTRGNTARLRTVYGNETLEISWFIVPKKGLSEQY